MKKISFTMALVAVVAFVLGAGEVLSQDLSALIFEHFTKKTQISSLPKEITMEEAFEIQKNLVKALGKELGKEVGYKAGLTNPKAQEAFGVREPVLGVLFEKMLVPSGSKISAAFGARPVSEGDLIVRIGDERINTAKDFQEAINYIDQIIPFIELPDLMYSPQLKLTGPMIVAINVGARLGILGRPIEVTGKDNWYERLKNFRLELYDKKGEKISEGTGQALLGDPMAVVFWIRDELKRQGQGLKKGDLLSLGTITKMIPVQPGTSLKAKYIDLDPKGPVEISVEFE